MAYFIHGAILGGGLNVKNMKPETGLLIFAALTWVVFLAGIALKFGVLKSISDSVNHLNRVWVFQAVMILPSFALMYVGNTPLFWFAGFFLILVGISPAGHFSPDMEERVHIVGATGGIILAMAGLWLNYHQWWLVVPMILFTGYCLSKWSKVKNHTWWIEVWALVTALIGLLIKIL